jgi:hypothetical protein
MRLKKAQPPPEDASERLIVKHKTIRVLLNTGSSGDLLFLKKGSNKYIPIVSIVWTLHKEGESGDKQTKNYKSLGEVFKTYNKGKLRPSLIPSSLFDCNGPMQSK